MFLSICYIHIFVPMSIVETWINSLIKHFNGITLFIMFSSDLVFKELRIHCSSVYVCSLRMQSQSKGNHVITNGYLFWRLLFVKLI